MVQPARSLSGADSKVWHRSANGESVTHDPEDSQQTCNQFDPWVLIRQSIGNRLEGTAAIPAGLLPLALLGKLLPVLDQR